MGHHDHSSQIVGLLLAAGESKRMGRPKQLLPYAATTLVDHAANLIASSGCGSLVIVTGKDTDAVVSSIGERAAEIAIYVPNPSPADGLTSSLWIGLEAIAVRFPDCQRVLIGLGDQPLIPSHHLISLIQSVVRPIEIAATQYPSGGGVPACFAFSRIRRQLTANQISGQQMIRNSPPQSVKLVPCPPAQSDVDTQADYDRIRCERVDS